jgi:UDP-galactopyranose mutase
MRLDVSERDDGVHIVVPYLPEGLSSEVARQAVLRRLIDSLFAQHQIKNFIAWYYTPMALEFTQHLKPQATIYDCMDELSAFKGAHTSLQTREQQLFSRCDLVFTGGQTLYEAKRTQHDSVHAFPSSIDRAHFGKARSIKEEPVDQRSIPHPRLGFFGVIDERFDIELLKSCQPIFPGGTWPCCCSRVTKRRVLSVLRKLRNTWRQASQWFQLRFAMWSGRMASRSW